MAPGFEELFRALVERELRGHASPDEQQWLTSEAILPLWRAELVRLKNECAGRIERWKSEMELTKQEFMVLGHHGKDAWFKHRADMLAYISRTNRFVLRVDAKLTYVGSLIKIANLERTRPRPMG